MVKNATTWQAGLTAPATFWASLFVSTAVANCLALQAIASEVTSLRANEVQNTVASASAPQAASTESSAEVLPLKDVTSVAEFPLNQKNTETNKIQDPVAVPPTTTAQTTPIETSPVAPALGDVTPVTELNSNLGDSDTNDPMSQVTNVSQLRDVSPGDWAYEALRSLVERYGCIAGYPDGTFRGRQATTRYEFAAGLNACLQQVERLITSGTQGLATRQDLETLQRLVQEFRPELTTLGARVDKLEGRTAFLEDHQFSVTTKLNGLAWFNLTGASANGDVRVETTNLNGIGGDLALRQAGRGPDNQPIVQRATKDPNVTLSNLVWLSFNTSFTGKDNLVTQLAVGNGNSPAHVFGSARS